MDEEKTIKWRRQQKSVVGFGEREVKMVSLTTEWW